MKRRCFLATVSAPALAARNPVGGNRIQIEVDDLARMVVTLKQTGAKFRNDIVTGNGGKQILLEDPAGNPIELFEPTRR